MYHNQSTVASARQFKLSIPTSLSSAETFSWIIIEGAERVAREVCELYLSLSAVAARHKNKQLLDECENQVKEWNARHATLCFEAAASLQRGIMASLLIVRDYAVTGVRLALLEHEYGEAMLETYLEDGE